MIVELSAAPDHGYVKGGMKVADDLGEWETLPPWHAVRMRVGAAILYLVAMLGVVALAKADIAEALLIWSAASLCLGWTARWPWLALLPLLASPIAVPFGYPEDWSGREVMPLWFEMLWAALGQAIIVIVGFSGRHLYDRSRMSRT
jgi:hypothetical protein